MAQTSKRPGTWVKGQSGNPAGRPKLPDDYKTRIRDYTEQAISVLADALTDPDVRARVAAARELLDRGWGKAAVTLDATLRQEIDPSQAHLEALRALVTKRRDADESPGGAVN